MDSSASPAQDVQNQTSSDPKAKIRLTQGVQSVTSTQSTTQDQKQQQKTTQQISTGKETESGYVVSQDQDIEVAPTIPEVKIEKSLEGVVEKAAEHEELKLEKDVQNAGVTRSGPGVIDPAPKKLVENKLPAITYEQATLEEKKTPFKNSKHWFLGLLKFVLRKLKEKNREGVTV